MIFAAFTVVVFIDYFSGSYLFINSSRKTSKMIAAAYIRVSTEDQTEFSPQSQLKRIMEYAHYNQLQIPEEYVFIDEGISGRTASKRPGFQKMISLARSCRPFQKILVWKFSRFARNRQDSIFYKSMLRRDCGIEVISITEPLSQDPTSILIEALLEAMDEYYSINLAQEVRRGMQERFSRGKAISLPPFGYQMGSDGFIANPLQSVWLPVIFEDYIAGNSPREIADKLNAAGVRTTRGNYFQPRNITYILHNPVYIGKLRKRSTVPPFASGPVRTPCYDRNYVYTKMDVIEGNHQPLIDSVLWELAQKKWHLHPASATDNECKVRIPDADTPAFVETASSTDYFLKGLVFCSNCGGHLVRIHKGAAFQCSNYNHGICHKSHYVKTDVLEALVAGSLSASPSSAALHLKQASVSGHEKNELLHHMGIKIIYHKSEKQVELCPWELTK